MLLPIENILSQEEVKHIRQRLAKESWLDGKQSAGAQAAKVKANLQLDESTQVYQALSEFVLQKVSSHPLWVSAALPEKIFPPKFNCYQEGGHYGLHVDSAVMNLANGACLRTDISMTLFLSDPEEYEGGELSIETKYGVQSVKLNQGDLILYPSSSLHQVNPVMQGSRICAFFWAQSMVRSEQQRELLFDLDQTIQSLSLQEAQREEIDRLTGIYHNLLRQWAC